MKRRSFAQSMLAFGLSLSGIGKASGRDRIVVVGAGIVGASIAYHLAKRGADVTIIDKDGSAEHASGSSFAWINAIYHKQPFSYHLLSRLSVLTHRSLQAELNLPVRWGGSLVWYDSPQEQQRLAEAIARQQSYGAPVHMIEQGDAQDLESQVRFGAAERIAYAELDGAMHAAATTKLLIEGAQKMGAVARYPLAFQGVVSKRGTVRAVTTSAGELAADHVVIAAGIDAESIAKDLGVSLPQVPRPGIIATSKPMPRLIHRVIVAPGIHIHQRDDGRVVMGEEAGAPDTVEHRQRLQNRPRTYPDPATANDHGLRIRAIGERIVPALANARLEKVTIGWRPIPLDGHPVIGAYTQLPNVYFAVMHSGVTLSAIAGQLAAIELLDGVRSTLLEDFRPQRFS